MLFTRSALFALLISSSYVSFAQQLESVPIPENNLTYSSSPSINKGAEQTERCNDLYKNVQSLKGKPQRRYAANELYKAECLSNR